MPTRGAEAVTYLDERLKPALEETLGVILWQEQVLKVAHDIAGFRHGQGEMLRRALGSKYSFQLLDQLEVVFMEGALKNGVEEEVARTIFEQLRGFGAYSFAKSHAASFAVLTYQSAWFKPARWIAGAARAINCSGMPACSIKRADACPCG